MLTNQQTPLNTAEKSACENTSGHSNASVARPETQTGKTVFLVDHCSTLRDATFTMLKEKGFNVSCYPDIPAFLMSYQHGRMGCVLVDELSLVDGDCALVAQLEALGVDLPIVMMSHAPTYRMAVNAIKSGAFDFVDAPDNGDVLCNAIKSAFDHVKARSELSESMRAANQRIASLTSRQYEILKLVIAGHPSKNIAADLRISQRTVDNHRAAIGRKTGTKNLSALIQTALHGGCAMADSFGTETSKQHAVPSQLLA